MRKLILYLMMMLVLLFSVSASLICIYPEKIILEVYSKETIKLDYEEQNVLCELNNVTNQSFSCLSYIHDNTTLVNVYPRKSPVIKAQTPQYFIPFPLLANNQSVKVYFGVEDLEPHRDYDFMIECFSENNTFKYEDTLRVEYKELINVVDKALYINRNIPYIIMLIIALIVIFLIYAFFKYVYED